MLKAICFCMTTVVFILNVQTVYAQTVQNRKGAEIMRQMDTDANGSISHAEFINFGKAYYKRADQNADQKLTTMEYALMLEMLGSVFPSEVFIKRFNILDMNRDGVISAAEFNEISQRKFRKGDVNGDGEINQADLQ